MLQSKHALSPKVCWLMLGLQSAPLASFPECREDAGSRISTNKRAQLTRASLPGICLLFLACALQWVRVPFTFADFRNGRRKKVYIIPLRAPKRQVGHEMRPPDCVASSWHWGAMAWNYNCSSEHPAMEAFVGGTECQSLPEKKSPCRVLLSIV